MRTEYQQKLEHQQQSSTRHTGPRAMRGGGAAVVGGGTNETHAMRGGGAKLSLSSPGNAPVGTSGKGKESGLLSRLLGGKEK